MSLKTLTKQLVLGSPGLRPRHIRRGLLRGLTFHIDTGAKSQRLLGLDEAEIASSVRALAAEAVTALDIGANDGWYSLYFASRPNIERVLAFEPTSLLDGLRRNFAANDPAFAAKLSCVARFVGNRSDSDWCTIDEVAADLRKPVLLKIDVDGGEMDVLRGARGLLATLQCRLVVETHSSALEAECLAFLRDLRYVCQVIRNGWYRAFLPEARRLAHNRWLVARPR